MSLQRARRILLASSLSASALFLFLVSLDGREAGARGRELDEPVVPADLLERVNATPPVGTSSDGALIAELQEAQAKQDKADRAARLKTRYRRGDVEFVLTHTAQGDVWMPHLVEAVGIGEEDFGGY